MKRVISVQINFKNYEKRFNDFNRDLIYAFHNGKFTDQNGN